MRIRPVDRQELGDQIHRPPPGADSACQVERYSEWHHFNVNDDANGLYGIFNLALSGDIRDAERGRVGLSLVICERGRWQGSMELYRVEEARFRPRAVDLHIGPNSVRLQDGRYLVAGGLKSGSVVLDATWTPLCSGIRIENIGNMISAFILPRLSVEGTITIEGRKYRLDGATGYHDHNWGHWSWGRDLGWDWGYFLQKADGGNDPPLSIVFGQVTDATRTAARSDLVVLVWEGEQCTQVFLDDAVEMTTSGALPASRVPRVPGILSLVELQRRGVPKSLVVSAGDGADALELRMDVDNGLQFLIPQPAGTGITTVSELVGRYRVRGRLDGRLLDFSYVGFAELAG